jgi:cell division protein FtsQ
MLILLGAVALTVLVIAANIHRSQSQVRGIEVKLRYGQAPPLVAEQTVIDSIHAALPHLTTTRVKDIDRDAVADAAAHVPYLRDISTAVSVSGKVVIRATQRRPIARLFYGHRELYFDSEGAMMPVSRIGDCNVLVASGDFAEPIRLDSLNTQTAALVRLADFLDDHKNYRVLVDQIYIRRDGIIMMVPKIGDQIIELGDTENLDSKFDNLVTFYRKGMPRAGWDTYSKVSLRFAGQVVCTKRTK